MSENITIRSKFRDYEVCFVDDFLPILKQQMKEKPFFIIDQTVMELYTDKLKAILPLSKSIIIEARESTKTVDKCQYIVKTLIEKNVRKNSVLIAIGGGIIQDITAFVATILFRGIEWYFYPTTLLAQADSCIGSKSSINIGEYKNQVGTFYPPSKIVCDCGFLNTLPASEIKSGIGEILHFLFIAGDQSVQTLFDEYDRLLKEPARFNKYIRTSLGIKKKTIEIDEFDKNERNLFNYGHTFGHAIEAVSGYEVNHGQAVTMGMDIANHVSLNLGYLNEEKFESMHKILARNMPSFHLQNDLIEDFFRALSKDKKNIGKNLGCILTTGSGAMFKVQHPLDKRLQGVIVDYFKRIL